LAAACLRIELRAPDLATYSPGRSFPVFNQFKIRFAVSFLLLLVTLLSAQVVVSAPPIPNPILYFVGTESVSQNGKAFIRYKYDVFNKADFPAEMFAPAPNLPPCGVNTKASRTWVDFYDQKGKRLYGFCAINKPADLNQLYFALEADAVPPSWIYVELTDRQTNTKYKSNLAESSN
jgi:hypothetical protein